jgi:hypothetical protein
MIKEVTFGLILNQQEEFTSQLNYKDNSVTVNFEEEKIKIV